MDIIVDDRSLPATDQGFLLHWKDWDGDVALRLAEIDNIILTEQHWEIIRFFRNYYSQYKHLPNTRVFIKAVALTLGEDKGNSRYLHQLFPEGPLKYSAKLAGLPKPPTCL